MYGNADYLLKMRLMPLIKNKSHETHPLFFLSPNFFLANDNCRRSILRYKMLLLKQHLKRRVDRIPTGKYACYSIRKKPPDPIYPEAGAENHSSIP